MAAKIVKLVRPAEPNIVQVLEEFLTDQRSRLRPKTVAQYESVLHLLRGHLDGYGHGVFRRRKPHFSAAVTTPKAAPIASTPRSSAPRRFSRT